MTRAEALMKAQKSMFMREYVKFKKASNIINHLCDESEDFSKRSREYVDSLEEQIQGLQSLLDLKQHEISVLESKVGEVKSCDGCEYAILDHNGEIEDCISDKRCLRYFSGVCDCYEERQKP